MSQGRPPQRHLQRVQWNGDRAILDQLASDLTGARRALAVDALTEAAGETEFGRYVRDRLRQWMDHKDPADSRVDLVIDICAGPWGANHPAPALTRLGKAAGHKDFGSANVVHAFEQLALRCPQQVTKAVDQWLGDTATVRAAARPALDETACGITQRYTPEQLTTAQELLTLAAAHWHTPDATPDLWWKARITLRLTDQDAERAQNYQDALREVTLQFAQEHERRERFAQAVLDRLDATRVWWLDRHLEDLDSLDWNVFKEKVLPLVGTADDVQSTAERIAHALLYVWEKLGDNPGQHARFTTTVRTVLDQMGWNYATVWPAPAQPPVAGSPESSRGGQGSHAVPEAGTARWNYPPCAGCSTRQPAPWPCGFVPSNGWR